MSFCEDRPYELCPRTVQGSLSQGAWYYVKRVWRIQISVNKGCKVEQRKRQDCSITAKHCTVPFAPFER